MADYDSDGSEATLVWTPTDKADKTLKEIFENKLATATNGVLEVKVTSEKTYKNFVLDSQSFFDLQTYVMSAADLPQTNEKFQEMIPEEKCKKLTDLDAEIYQKTKEAMVGVATSCAIFAKDGLPKMVSSVSLTISYCKYALTNLVHDDETNIRHNLEIIMKDKYEEKDSWDNAFLDARDTAKASLEELAAEANKKKEEIDKIYQTLLLFKQTTMNLEDRIKFLRRQYKDGPVVNSNKEITKPYASILNDKLQKAIDDVAQKVEGAQVAERVKKMLYQDCGGLLGFFGGSIMTTELKACLDSLESQLKKARTEQAEITILLEKVNLLTKQFEKIGEIMQSAIKGLSELSNLFLNQSKTYDTLATYLSDLETVVTKHAALRLRKKFIMKHLNGSIDCFTDLQSSVEEFKDNIVSQTELGTARATREF